MLGYSFSDDALRAALIQLKSAIAAHVLCPLLSADNRSALVRPDLGSASELGGKLQK